MALLTQILVAFVESVLTIMLIHYRLLGRVLSQRRFRHLARSVVIHVVVAVSLHYLMAASGFPIA